MNNAKRGIGRAALYTGVIGALLLSSLPAAGVRTAAAQPQSRNLGPNNIPVAGRFLEEWLKPGSEQNSVYVNGWPITPRRAEISTTDGKVYETQWFERARFEAHPENKAPYDVLFGLLGVTLAEGRGSVDPATKRVRNPADAPFVGIDQPADVSATKLWFPQTRHSISGKILEYWNRYGGVAQFGFPISEPFKEISEADGKTYDVQYFERNRFELHPEKAAPYEVELGLLGVQQYKLTPVPADQLPFAPPANVRSTKDDLIVGLSQEPSTLFIDYVSSVVSRIASGPLFNALVEYDDKANLVPALAWYAPTLENNGARFVGVGDDRFLQVKYKLRRGIKWSDGKEVTSNDVLFYYKLYLNPDAQVADRELQEKLSSMDNPDKYTVVANFMSYKQAAAFYSTTTDKQHFQFLQQFVENKKPVTHPTYFAAGAGVLPEHILGKVPADKILDFGFGSKPEVTVGTGPFKLERWDVGQQMILVANPNYNLTAPPLLKRIVIKFFGGADGVNQLIAQLRTGALDAATQESFVADPIIDELGKSGLTVHNIPALSWEHMDFNFDVPGLNDKAVRQAFAYGIDRERISRDLTQGKYPVGHTFVAPGSWGSSKNPEFPKDLLTKYPLKEYKYDPAMAMKLLDDAGWKDTNGDGVRDKGGVKLSFEHSSTALPIRPRIQALVQQDMKAIGIETRIVTIPASVYFADGAEGTLTSRKFQIGHYAFNSPPEPDADIYDSAKIPSPENAFSGQNYPGYKNPAFDAAARAHNGTIDRRERQEFLAQAQSIYSEDLPSLQIFVRTNIEITKPSVTNWKLTGTGGVYALWNSQQLYFK